jgi:transposase-like protein
MPKPAAAAPSSPRRRRWKIAEARSILAALASSGLSLPEFAIRKGLEPQRLRRWRRQFAREVRRPAGRARPARTRPAAPTPPAVIELLPSPNLRPVEPVEIVLTSGVTLRVAETIDPAALARLVTALKRGC